MPRPFKLKPTILRGFDEDCVDTVYSNSPASLQQIAANRFVYNVLACEDFVHKSVVSTTNPFDVVQSLQSEASLPHAHNVL
jgi:hypothetical protein